MKARVLRKQFIQMSKKVFIASGAGFSGDRFDAAVPLVAHLSSCDGPRYLIFEVLAERTIALAQIAKSTDPDAGYSPYLDNYLRPVLRQIKTHNIKIVSNMGAANPVAAARHVNRLAAELDLPPFKIAVLQGDDLSAYLDEQTILQAPTMEGNRLSGRELKAANVYLGGDAVAKALANDVDMVLVGRTTDSALVLGPLLHEFGWHEDDWDRLAAGTICGHLLECGAQVTGAYFADPGFKDVPALADVGFPVAEISDSGTFVITKPNHTGGCVTTATVTEQLLYEMHDPSCYIVPDVCADVTGLHLTEESENRIRIEGIKGTPRPVELKATVCVDGGFMAETELSYAGLNSLERAKLAGDVVIERMKTSGFNGDIRRDIIGAYSVLDGGSDQFSAGSTLPFDGDYRVRLSLISTSKEPAQKLCDELQHLYCSGPAAGGGFRGSVTPQMASASILLDRDLIEPHITVEVVDK